MTWLGLHGYRSHLTKSACGFIILLLLLPLPSGRCMHRRRARKRHDSEPGGLNLLVEQQLCRLLQGLSKCLKCTDIESVAVVVVV